MPTMTMTKLVYGCYNIGQNITNISIIRFTPPSRAWRRPQSRLDEKKSPLFFSCLSLEMKKKKFKTIVNLTMVGFAIINYLT